MKFSVKTNQLRKAFTNAIKVINPKASVPVTANVHIKVDQENSRLVVTAVDTEVAVQTTVGYTSLDGPVIEEFLLAPQHLAAMLREYKGENVAIEVKDNILKCNLEKGSYQFALTPSEMFPLPTIEGELKNFTVEPETFIDNMISVGEMTADDSNRPVMESVLIEVGENGITLVASDARRLLCCGMEVSELNAQPSQLLIHKRILPILKELLVKEMNEQLTVAFNDKNVRFTLGNETLTCRMVVGKFPNYKAVIPKPGGHVAKISKAELLDTVKRLSSCADKVSNNIKLSLAENRLALEAQDLGFQVTGKESIEIAYNGEPMQIGFNGMNLISVFKTVPTKDVVVHLYDPTRAVLIKADNEDDSTIAILMPVKI